MPNNIFPDLSNNQFDIRYARLKALPGDILGLINNRNLSTSEDSGDTPTGEGGRRFGFPTEDFLAGEDRAFDLTDDYNFLLHNDGNELLQVIGSSGQVAIGQYGSGVFEEVPEWGLGVDALGNIVEYLVGGSGGGGNQRFGFAGEDDLAGEDRSFELDGFSFDIKDSPSAIGSLLFVSALSSLIQAKQTDGINFGNASLTLSADNTTPFGTFELRAHDNVNGLGVNIDGSSVTQTMSIQASALINIVSSNIKFTSVQEFADNAAAITGGLVADVIYRTGDFLKVVH